MAHSCYESIQDEIERSVISISGWKLALAKLTANRDGHLSSLAEHNLFVSRLKRVISFSLLNRFNLILIL